MGRKSHSSSARPRTAMRSSTPPDGAVDGFVSMVGGFKPAWETQPRRSATFAEFRRIVRRFRPSALLPELARLSVLLDKVSHDHPLYRTSPPWAMALAARESILYGNEHRIDVLRDGDLRVLFNTYNGLHEDDANPEDFDPLKVLVRLAYEQFPYQEVALRGGQPYPRSHGGRRRQGVWPPGARRQRGGPASRCAARADGRRDILPAGCREPEQRLVRPGVSRPAKVCACVGAVAARGPRASRRTALQHRRGVSRRLRASAEARARI